MKSHPLITSRRGLLAAILVQTAVLIAAPSVHAVLFVVPEAALSAPVIDPTTIVHFDEIPYNMAINGQTIKGFTFLENIPNAMVDGGPGDTNHITVPNAVSGSGFNPATYVLTINMPTAETSFGFGFAILATIPTANAVTITLFDGATNLGSLTYGGLLDPTFAGGFVGIGSTGSFNIAKISFGLSAAAYAIDNVAARAPVASSVPDSGSTFALLGFALLGLTVLSRSTASLEKAHVAAQGHR